MASSSCPKCGHHSFELKETKIRGAQYSMYFVQCSSCGSVINSTEYYDSGVLLKKQEEKLEHLEKLINYLVAKSK